MDALFDVTTFILPILAFGTVLFVASLNIYFNIRKRFSVRVNCWFCNNNTRVPYDEQNCWTCIKCEQYNGFTSDGNYNCDMSKQYYEYLNTDVYSKYSEKTNSSNSNGLCVACNRNQQLKIQQLASFTPNNEANFDYEVEAYSRKLEEAYKLCHKCNKVLKKAIIKSKTLLLRQQLAFIRTQGLKILNLNSSSVSFQRKQKFIVSFLRFIILILSIVYLVILVVNFKCDESVVFRTVWPYTSGYINILWTYISDADNKLHIVSALPITFNDLFAYFNIYLIDTLSPALFNLTTASDKLRLPNISEGGFYKNNDLLITSTALLLLMCIVVLHKYSFNTKDFLQMFLWLISFGVAFSNKYGPNNRLLKNMDEFKISVGVILLVLSLRPSKTSCYRSIINESLLSENEIFKDEEDTNTPLLKNKIKQKTKINKKENNLSSKTENGKAFPIPMFNSKSTSSKIIFDNYNSQRKFDIPLSHQTCANVQQYKKNIFPLQSFDQKHVKTNTTVHRFGQNSLGSVECLFEPISNKSEEDIDLNRLRLSETNRPISPLSTCSIFSTRKYNGNSSNLFAIKPVVQNRPILLPSRLDNNLTQSSWVGGGFWTQSRKHMVNMNLGYTPLSRTSSQSSGFESHGSSPCYGIYNSLPPSRESSICGDFDHSSVLSEPAYHSNNYFQHNSIYGSLNDSTVYPFSQKKYSNVPSRIDTFDSNHSKLIPNNIIKNRISNIQVNNNSDVYFRQRSVQSSLFSNRAVNNQINNLGNLQLR